MNKKITTLGMAVLLGISSLTFNGCRGKDGATGPAGTDGNANVHSMTFNITVWNYSSPSFWVTLNDPQITQDIINTGAVLVYNSDGTNNAQLPLTIYPSSSYSETWTPYVTVGSVEVDVTDSDLTQPNTPGPTKFKVVVMSSRMMLTNPHINFNDYESVKQAFKLKD